RCQQLPIVRLTSRPDLQACLVFLYNFLITASRDSAPEGLRSERRLTSMPAMSEPAGLAWSMAVHLAVLSLLVGVERLVKGCIGLGMSGGGLRHQVADGVRGLFNAGAVILLGCRLQVLVCRPHLVVQRFHVRGSIGKDGCSLLLLCRRETQFLRQKVHAAL